MNISENIKQLLKLAVFGLAALSIGSHAEDKELTFVSGAEGGAFLPFADGAAKVISESGYSGPHGQDKKCMSLS